MLLVMPDARIHRVRLGPGRWLSLREAPLTLTTLAALVPAELDARLTLADESVRRVPLDTRADLVAISCITGAAQRAYELAAHFRKRGATVVLGGVHVTLCPDEAAAHADAIVVGFAERTWPALLRDWRQGRLRRVYRDPAPPPLDGLPDARRDLQAPFAYAMPNTVFATRGCRGTCDFCTVPAAGFGWHTRPVAEVAAEVRRLPGRRFVFNDVSLAEDRDYALALCAALKPLRRRWGGLVTARVGDDDELLDAMAGSGCVYLLLGFESVSAPALRAMGKRYNAAHPYDVLVRRLHARGIAVQGCFIFGLDDDGPGVFDATVAAVDAASVDIPRYAIYTPYPGTRAFERLAAEGRLLHRHWRHYDTQHVVIRPAGLSPAQLDAGFRRAYRRTFTLPRILRRAAASPHPAVTLVGNLAYRRYVARLDAERDRILDAATPARPAGASRRRRTPPAAEPECAPCPA